MTTIRNSPFPQAPQGQIGTPRDDQSGKLAAQRAFFAAIQGQTPAAAPQATASTRTAAPSAAQAQAPVQRVPAAAPSEPPQRILRPGSLLDIRV